MYEVRVSSSLKGQPCLQERFQTGVGACCFLGCFRLPDLLEECSGAKHGGSNHRVRPVQIEMSGHLGKHDLFKKS